MPSVIVGPYSALSEVYTLARACLNDVQGAVETDAALLPYVNAAYRYIQMSLAECGDTSFINDDYEVTLLVSGATGSTPIILTFASTPALPGDMFVPFALWEKSYDNAANESFEPMTYAVNVLPDRIQPGAELDDWRWTSDTITFPKCNTNRIVRIQYQKFFQNVANSADPLAMIQTLNALGFFTAAYRAEAQGSITADKWESRGEKYLGYMKNRLVKATQPQINRRQNVMVGRLNLRRNGYGWGGWRR